MLSIKRFKKGDNTTDASDIKISIREYLKIDSNKFENVQDFEKLP